MILADTSAWIEFLRDTQSPVCDEVDRLLDDGLAVTEAVRMEVLAGARSDAHLRQLRGLLSRAALLPVHSTDFDLAARLFLTCRQRGETVRRLLDCLIAAVAVRRDVPVLHADRDFEALARCTALVVYPVSSAVRPGRSRSGGSG